MSNKRWLWMPILFALIGITGVFYVEYLGPEPVLGEVGSVPLTNDLGDSQREVRWISEDGEARTQVMPIPPTYRGLDVAPVMDRPGSESYISDGRTTPWFYALVAFIGLLLGATTEMTLRGYGYVRGTGEISETPDLDVAESHGFYWRT